MPIRRRTLAIAFGSVAALGLLGVVGYNYVDTALRADSTLYGDHNATPEDAMREGTFIRHVPVATDTLRTAGGGRMRFGRAWIHEESHIGFGWMARPRLVREGAYRLCFTLAEGEPAPGMSITAPPPGGPEWIVDVQTGLRYAESSSGEGPWLYCRDVARPFPASVSMTLVTDDSLRARMQQFVGTVHPPAPAATRHESRAVWDRGRTMLLTHTAWNGFRMLWISERVDGNGASARWRVRWVLEYPDAPMNYGVHYATCAVPGQAPAGTLMLRGLHSPRDDVNSAWRVDAATADLAPVPVAGLTCGKVRQF